MKKISLLLIILLFIGFGMFLSCERDDICPESTQTTPLLIIEFFDNTLRENEKFTTRLRVQGVDNDAVLDGYNIVQVKDLFLPLRTDANSTQYKLHKDYAVNDSGTPNDTSDDIITGNEDIITINYTTEQVFVSRACGYKTVFRNVSLTIEPDGDNWILSSQSLNNNQTVEDETTAHFNLFH